MNPLKPLEFSGIWWSFACFAILPYVVSLDSSLMRKNKGNFFMLSLLLGRASGRKIASFPGLRGRRYSWWFLHRSDPEVPAHPSVLHRWSADWLWRYVWADGNETLPNQASPFLPCGIRCLPLRGIQRLRPVLRRPWTVPYTPPVLPQFSAGCTPRSRPGSFPLLLCSS